MALFVNRCMLAGNLTRDPQVRFFANEKAVCDFGLAINRVFGSGENRKEETVFVDVTSWGRTAELCGQYLSKGRNVFVEGHLVLDQWEDQQGQKRSKLKVTADNVNFIDSGKRDGGNGDRHGQQNGQQQAPAPEVGSGVPPEIDDDAPPFM